MYESRCMLDSKISSKNDAYPGVYIGEIGRSLFDRADEHIRDDKSYILVNHIVKHLALHHPEEAEQPSFKIRVHRTHKSALSDKSMRLFGLCSMGS